MRKIISGLLITCMTLMICSVTGCAAEGEPNTADTAAATDAKTEIVLQIGNPIMTINGAETEIDPGRGTVPVLVNDRTLLPIRSVVEAVGGSVAWEENTQTATLTYGENVIRLTIGSTAAYVNDTIHTLDVTPTLINDRTMLPIRFIAENFQFEVAWNADTQEITITVGAIQMPNTDNMVLIQGGTYTMGSPEEEHERDSDEVRHEVTVSSFYIAPTEVTQAEYQAIAGSNPSENPGEQLPVENVSWYDAIRYCNALSEAEGLEPCYTISGSTVTWNKAANGYRLPTEAEWEYACRANTDTPFSFGDYVYDSNANCYNAYGYNNDASGRWVNGYLEHTVNVTDYAPNGYGLYNMHGNVSEWVWDWYGAYDTEAAVNPTGADSGNDKVARGGAWNDFPKHIRSAYRSAFPADVPFYGIGFRLVRSAQPEDGSVVSTNHANAEVGKPLIVYFSQTGNTDGLAEIIHEISGADIFRLERETPYSSTQNSQGLYAEALTEYRENAVPNLKTSLEDAGLNIDDYDTIILGYCNWWASIPACVRTFLTQYDLSGKTIIPFCSMGGGRFGQTISAVAKLAPDSTIKQGLDITYSSYDREEISRWLQDNDVPIQ